MSESQLQSQIIRWLKSKGAYVIKTQAGPGVPTGCPDVLFLFESVWGVIEVKASKTAKMQPGQALTLKKMSDWNPFVYKVYPDNWQSVKQELTERFF